MIPKDFPFLRSPVTALLAVALSCVWLAGCAATPAQLVRDAQNSFSRGSEIEMMERYSGRSAVDAESLSSARQHYGVALERIDRALDESEGELRRDRLYGVALTLRALSSWRLWGTGASEEGNELLRLSLDSAAQVVTLSEEGGASALQVWPRDRILCQSLPTLIEVDKLGVEGAKLDGEMEPADRDAEVESLLARADRAATDLRSLRTRFPDHPVRIYLAQSECELAWVLVKFIPTAYGDGVPDEVSARVNQLVDDALLDLEAIAALSQHSENSAPLQRFIDHYRNKLVKV